MGFLKTFGRPLEFNESDKAIKVVKDNGVEKPKRWKIDDNFDRFNKKFGYEFEFHKIYLDDEAKKVKIDLSGEKDVEDHEHVEDSNFEYQVEFGKWMVESTFINL